MIDDPLKKSILKKWGMLLPEPEPHVTDIVKQMIKKNLSVRFSDLDLSKLYQPYIPLQVSSIFFFEEHVDRSRFPHDCPRCGSPAYVGFTAVDCTKEGCGTV